MEVKDYVKYYDNVFNIYKVQTCLLWLNKAYEDKKFIPARVGSGIGRLDSKIRNCETYWFNVDHTSVTANHWHSFFKCGFNKVLEVYINELKPFVGAPDLRFKLQEMSAIRYQKENHYDYHQDQGFNSARRYSIIYFLNNDYEGGELSFMNKEGEFLKLKPKQNRIVVFPSNFIFYHSVLPIKEGLRWTIVSWAI
jgi:hypothetical protein